jgi:hypothetical protein
VLLLPTTSVVSIAIVSQNDSLKMHGQASPLSSLPYLIPLQNTNRFFLPFLMRSSNTSRTSISNTSATTMSYGDGVAGKRVRARECQPIPRVVHSAVIPVQIIC